MIWKTNDKIDILFNARYFRITANESRQRIVKIVPSVKSAGSYKMQQSNLIIALYLESKAKNNSSVALKFSETVTSIID